MHLEAEIERTQRGTWKPWVSVLRDTLGGHDRTRLVEYLEAVDVEASDRRAVNREAMHLEAVRSGACAMEAETLFIR